MANHPGTALRIWGCGKKEGNRVCYLRSFLPISFASPHLTPPLHFLDLPLSLVSAIGCTVRTWTSAGSRLCGRMILHVVCTLWPLYFYLLPPFFQPFLIFIFRLCILFLPAPSNYLPSYYLCRPPPLPIVYHTTRRPHPHLRVINDLSIAT